MSQKENTKQKIGDILHTVYAEVDSLHDTIDELVLSINSYRSTKELLSEKIVELRKEVEILDTVKNEVDSLKIRREEVQKELSEISLDVKNAQVSLDTLIRQHKETMENNHAQLEAFLKENDKERKFLIEEKARLQKQKEKQDKRDEDLQIVENRWFRLFSEKGASFRVTK